MFEPGQAVMFGGAASRVVSRREIDGVISYLIENGPVRLPIWVPEPVLTDHQLSDGDDVVFHMRPPAVVVVDDFFRNPDQIRTVALAQQYGSDVRYFKGLRTHERFLWPGLREEFGRLIGRSVTEWLEHAANGVFQQTNHDDPLVFHHDSQQYAAAVYLTPGGPPSGGTSFWRDRKFGCRRGPGHPLEAERLRSLDAIEAARAAIYDEATFVDPSRWELIESVAGLYNRLVIWDAQLIHSATSYECFANEAGAGGTRLVQLFFFDAE